MSVITTGQIVDLLDANLNTVFQDGTEGWGEEYSKVFNVINSTKQSEKYSYTSGFGMVPEKPEGVAAAYDAIIPGISKRIPNLTYALGYEITEEAIEDNLHTPETFNKLPQALNRSAEETVEVSAFSIFNNGFTTNGFDGVPLFSTAHPTLDGATQSNTPSTQADLSVTSFTAGVTAVEKYTDERGLKKPSRVATLLVPVDSWNIAEELLGSDYKPYTANNEVNALMKKNISYMVGHYLTDTDAWFLLAAKGDHHLMFQWRVKLGQLRKGQDFDSTNLKHLARMRFGVDYYHWFGTYGSSGA